MAAEYCIRASPTHRTFDKHKQEKRGSSYILVPAEKVYYLTCDKVYNTLHPHHREPAHTPKDKPHSVS